MSFVLAEGEVTKKRAVPTADELKLLILFDFSTAAEVNDVVIQGVRDGSKTEDHVDVMRARRAQIVRHNAARAVHNSQSGVVLGFFPFPFQAISFNTSHI